MVQLAVGGSSVPLRKIRVSLMLRTLGLIPKRYPRRWLKINYLVVVRPAFFKKWLLMVAIVIQVREIVIRVIGLQHIVPSYMP